MITRRGFFGTIAALLTVPFVARRIDPWVRANPALFDGRLSPDYLNEYRYRVTFVVNGHEVEGSWLMPTFTVKQQQL